MNRDMAYSLLSALSTASLALTTLQYTGNAPYAMFDKMDATHSALHEMFMALMEELNPTTQPTTSEVFDFA